jgi:hypothetical protein
MKRIAILATAATVLLLADCGGDHYWSGSSASEHRGGPRGMRGDPSGTAAGIKQMLRYDANKDGIVARAEMEAGLKTEFTALDKNHDGKLESDEVRAENDRRYAEFGTQYSPLLDWNQDALIDYGEYANASRSLFDQLDSDHDGVLSGSELKAPHGPTLEEEKKPEQGQRGGY